MKLRTFADCLQLLDDMREYAAKARRFSAGKGLVDLQEDEAYRFSILYPLQVVGEAAGKVPVPARQMAPEIAWSLIANFRHVVVHGYGEVKLDKVQSILDDEIDPLLAELERLIVAVEALGDKPLG